MKYLRFLLLIASACLLGGGALQAQVKVSFATKGQTVLETDVVSVVVQLDQPSLLEVLVPYDVDPSSTATLGSDFEFPADDASRDFYNQSPLRFAPGETRKVITVRMINDDLVEDPETAIIRLIPNGLTVAVLGEITQHMIRIIDNDPINVYFDYHENDFYENENINIPVRLSSRSAKDVQVYFKTDLLTAGSNDVDLANASTTVSPLVITAGTQLGFITIKVVNDNVTDRNEGGADKETLRVSMIDAKVIGTDITLGFDQTPFVATIVDNDPIRVEFLYSDEVEQPFELQEYQTNATIQVRLLAPDGTVTTAAEDIKIPITYGGTATRGNGSDFDYRSDDNEITITAGNSTASITLIMNNDDLVEGDESIELALGTPRYASGSGDVVLGSKSQMSFVIKDNDPITLTFGALYSKDDEEAAKNPDIVDIEFIPSSGSLVAEGDGFVQIPYFLSSFSANAVEFDLEIVGAGTSATMFNSSDRSNDQAWDYSVTSHALPRVDSKTRVVLRAGQRYGLISVTLNNDKETPVIFGQPAGSDVEPDETIQFRISNLNTSSSKVAQGEHDTYTVTIRDLPDIDITGIVSGLAPDPAYLVNGTPPFNQKTGLFDVRYSMALTQQLDPQDFAGYRSLKVQFRTSNYDASNPESRNNDPLVQVPANASSEVKFDFYVDSPFQLRYPSTTESIILFEGAEAKDNKYDVTTADTIELAPYILKPLNLPPLNDFQSETKTAFDINEPLPWTVNFYSRGYFTLPIERLDPASNPNRIRVYLTTDGTQYLPDSAVALPIERFQPQPDGSVLLMVDVSSTLNVQIQYLDPGDRWRSVIPASIATSGSSWLHWTDTGPPMTQRHPSEVPFRLYRVIAK
jgi:hypothetical protein